MIDEIVSIELNEEEEVFDITVDHPLHTFYANDISVENCAHATAYAIDSYWCAWLLTYHEEAWISAYLESMSNTPESKAKAFNEVRAMGYKIVPVDINYAGLGWTVLPGKKLMPSMTSCRGVGDAAVEEIMKNRPYNTIEELLWTDDFQWKHSKFNRRALEALVKVGAFGSLNIVGEGCLFKNYRHMHEVLFGSHVESVTKKRKGIETTEDVELDHHSLLHRSPKSDPYEGLKSFYDLVRENVDIDDWSALERAENMVEVFGSIDVQSTIPDDIIAALDKKGIRSIDELEQDETDVVWYVTIPTSYKKGIKPTTGSKKKTKAGKDYVQVNASGLSGAVHRVSVWGCKELPDPFSLFCAEVKRDDFGASSTVWKVKKIT